MSVDAATVSYVLSSIASVGKLLEFGLGLHDRSASATEIAAVQQQATIAAAKRFGQGSPVILAMPSQIVEVIRTRIDTQRGRIIKVLSDPYMPLPERDQRLQTERRELCWAIHQIKYHNGGVLPPDLQEEWDLNICDNYNFTI